MSDRAPESLPRLGFVLLAGITLFWGLNFPAMKIVLGELTPWTFRAVCLSFGGLGLMVINRLSGVSNRLVFSDLKLLALTSLFMVTGWQLSSAFGLGLLSSGRAVIIAYTMPLWAAVLGRFLLNDRLTKRRIIGLVTGLTGLGVLIGPDLITFESAPVGVLLLLVSAWCWAAGTVLFKRGPWTMPISAVVAWMFLIGGIPVFIGAAVFETPDVLFNMSLKAVLTLAYVVAFPMWFCHWAYYKVVSLFPVSLASIGVLLIPPLGVLTGALVLGEAVGWRELSSLALVISALFTVMITPRPRKHRKSA